MTPLVPRVDHLRRAVVVELSAWEAHDLGRYLYREGLSSSDQVYRDGEELVKASHQLAGRCPEPSDCPLEEVAP